MTVNDTKTHAHTHTNTHKQVIFYSGERIARRVPSRREAHPSQQREERATDRLPLERHCASLSP